MNKWEYLILGVSGNKVLTVNGKDAEAISMNFFGSPGGSTELLEYLNWLGDIGWELAASNPPGKAKKDHISNTLIFKRVK